MSNNSNIGIASKDASEVYINKSRILNTNDCLAAYKKKQEFDGGFLKIANSECKNFKRHKFEDEFSKINLTKEL